MKYNDNGQWKDIQVKVANAIQNEYGESNNDGYSQNYLNDKLVNVGTETNDNAKVNFLKGNNLFNFDYASSRINITSTYSGSTLTLNGTSNAEGFNVNTPPPTMLNLKAGTYTLLIKEISGTRTGGQSLVIRNTTTNTNILDSPYSPTGTYTFTLSSDTNIAIIIYIRASGQTFTNYKFGIQLNEGSTALPYEDYITPSIYVDNEEIYSKDNIDIYSTNEIRIGTWIDGKPIYRKVYEKNNTTPGTTSYSIAPPTNLGTITKLDIMQYTANEGSYIHDYYNSSSDYLRIFYSSQEIQVRTSKTNSYNHYITIEYTKTTD